MFKRMISIILCLMLIMQSLPITAFADLNLESYATEAELRQAIEGDEKWKENFPNGLFNFIGTKFQIDEEREFFEIAVIRQGGTKGKVSVDFKAIDISAEYGKDYVIRVYENSSKNEMKKNPEAIPLIQTIGDNASITISESVYGAAETDKMLAIEPEEQIKTVTESVYSSVLSYTDLSGSKVTVGEGKSGAVNSLREARETYLNKESDRPNWRTLDESKVEELKAEYDRFLYNVEGAETTLEFDDGEYIKYLYLVPLNDKISESEEQVLFALERPSDGAVRGEFYMAYLNITDDEKPETVSFEIETPTVTANDGTASVVVRRKGGLEQYSSIAIGTEEGTAISGIDYGPGLEELFFTPGTSTQTVSVNILDNPARRTDRSFTIALDRTSGKVNRDAAEAVVTIPAGALKSSISYLPEVSPVNINAEKISGSGFSPAKGQWTITGPDLSANAMTNRQAYLNIETTYPQDGLKLEYTGDAGSWRSQYEMYSPISSLGGVNTIAFNYYNNGNGREESSGPVYDYNFKFLVFNKPYMCTPEEYDPRYFKSFDGQYGTPFSYETPVLDITAWRESKAFYFSAYAGENSHTAPFISGITLKLKPFSTNILPPGKKVQLKTYTIDKGIASADKEIDEFDPGSIYIKNVYSNVGNYQSAPTNPTVYRSDRIEFGYNYSARNANGKYSTFTGFEVKSGDNWVSFNGTELVLDANFFKTAGILEAVSAGKIEIRPVFKRNESGFTIYLDPVNGELANLSGANGYSYYYFMDMTTYVGDTIKGLEAKPQDVTKPASWTAKSGFFRNMKDNTTDLIMTNTDGKVTVSYTLENNANDIYLSFGEKLIVKAQPYLYRNRVYMLPYKVDGVQYSDREAFIAKMLEMYKSTIDNPTLEMNFDYTYESQFYEGDHPDKDQFGDPNKAYLRVYKADGSQRKEYPIDFYYKSEKYNIRSFKFSCKPKEEGWELGDYATIFIEGTKLDGDKYARTEESVVDFIANSRDGVIVTIPKDDKFLESWVGDINTPIVIEPANILGNYKFQAATSPGYTLQWMDGSPDFNNDGILSDEEQASMEQKLRAVFNSENLRLQDVWDSKVYVGNNFAYQPNHFNPSKVYYNFLKLADSNTSLPVKAKITEQFSTVLNPTELSSKLPVRNAEVYIGTKRIYDRDIDGDGKYDGVYSDKNYIYNYGLYYLGQLFYKGQIFNFAVTPLTDTTAVIYPSNLMRTYDFKAKIREGSTETDQKLDSLNSLLSIKDAVTTLSYRLDGSQAGIIPNDSIIRIYDDKGNVAMQVRTGDQQGGEFTYTMNTYAEGIKTGYSMTISGLLVKKETVVEGDTTVTKETILREYPEAEVGLTFSKPLTVLTALSSFKTPVKPLLKLMGELNNQYDLGMNVDLENKFTLSEYRDSRGMKRKIKTVTFGFNDEYEKKFGDNAKDTDASTDKGNDEVIKEETDTKDSDGLKDVVDGATPEADDPNQPKPKKSGGGDFHMPYKISLALTLELGEIYNPETKLYKEDGYHYFSSMVIMATATANYKYERTYMTPVGIPVTATISAGGGASAAIAFEADHKDPYNLKYQLNDEDNDGTISLNPKNYDIYSKFMITPTVTLGAAAGYDYLNLEISGTAKFDFYFTVPITGTAVSSSGGGGMRLSSELSLKILFVQKSWTLYDGDYIKFFSEGSGSPDKLAPDWGNPYQSYLYEKVTAPGADDIMSRAYLTERGEWGSGSNTAFGLTDVNAGDEMILQTGVFPYPQTKLVKIDQDRTLLLFIEDDTERDERNRASLMYSILEDGSSTPPVALDNNSTWDEAPDAFVIEDRILITWSDAGRIFTDADTEHDILSAMNISGMWFDPATETFGEKFAITKTVDGGDGYADINPKISYDPGTKRVMVYYTKTDHGDSWTYTPTTLEEDTVPLHETPEPLYGDIVNGYDVIAYRYADYNSMLDEFIWNETYTPEEKLDAAKYYGQRFPQLASSVKITESEVSITDETITVDGKSVTLTHTGTSQTIMPYVGMSDPRIVGMDLITHEGMAVFAYIMDYDSNLGTQKDYQLYIQTYDYSTASFSRPIEITNDDLVDTQPRFVEMKNKMYLYWLHDGNVVYTNISELLSGSGKLKEMTVSGSVYASDTFYIIDKADTTKDSHINTAIDEVDPIETYDIISNGSSVYALWTEERISYKNGLKPGDPGTDDAANINKERQIFAACATPPESIAGIETLPWSRPVQVTFEPGVSYSDLSFAILSDNEFLVSYAKYLHQYDAAAGYHTNSDSARELAVNLFTITSEAELSELTVDAEYPLPGKNVSVSAILSNTGLKALEDIYYQFYVDIDGSEYYTGKWYPEEAAAHYILGGTSTTIKDSFAMPETIADIQELKAGFRVKNGAGDILVQKEKNVPINPELRIHVKESILTGDDTAFISLYVENLGNKEFDDNFNITAGNKTLHTEQVKLSIGEVKQIALEVGLDGVSFGQLSTGEDGGRFDLLTLNLGFGDFETTADIKREISPEAYNELQRVESLKITRNGILLQNGSRISMDNKNIITLKEEIIKKTGIPADAENPVQLEVSWSSDRPDIVAALDNGVLAAMGSGTATVTAVVQPVTERALSYGDGYFKIQDEAFTIPESVKKKISFLVYTDSDSKDSDNTSGNQSTAKAPISGSVQTTEKVEGEKLILSFDEKALYEALKGSAGTFIFKSISENTNIKQLEMILTASNLKLIEESNVSRVTISSILGNISFDREAIAVIAAAVAEAGDKKAVIGFTVRNGIITVSVMVDGKEVTKLKGGAILVSTGYKPAELMDASGILVYDVSGEGTRKPIKVSMYHPETGEVIFKTTSTGAFEIGYNKVEFSDDLGWAKNHITFLSSRNIVMGAGKGIFLKEKAVTRAEFITMLSRLTEDLQLTDTEAKFKDVPSKAWYASQVKWAYENGIVSGTSDTEFSPDNPINREEMATMLYRFMKYAKMQLPQEKAEEFEDREQLSHWSVEAVNAMKAAGFMVGTGDNSFEPGRISNRAEAAKVIAEILKSMLK